MEKFNLIPCPVAERIYTYSCQENEQNEIGHLRLDWDAYSVYHSWWPGKNHELNDDAFKKEFYPFCDALFDKLDTVAHAGKWCFSQEGARGELWCDAGYLYFFKAETEHYVFYLRLWPYKGDYSYIYCYPKKAAE